MLSGWDIQVNLLGGLNNESAMPACFVCGNTDFAVNDGLYYCTTCQTQTQEIRDEDLEFQTNPDFVASQEKRVASDVNLSIELSKTVLPWTFIRILQYVLKLQVKALLKCGLPKSFSDTVFDVWKRYLIWSKLGFVPECERRVINERDQILRDEPHNLWRVVNQRGKGLYRFRNRDKSQKKKCAKTEDISDEDNEFEDDNENSSIKFSPEREYIELDKESTKDFVMGLKFPGISMTLTIIQAALFLHQVPVFFTDLVGMAYLDKIPYRNVVKFFPENLFLTNTETNMFGSHIVVAPQYIRHLTNMLLSRLHLKVNDLHDEHLKLCRIIKHYNLPEELALFVSSIIDECSSRSNLLSNYHSRDRRICAILIMCLIYLYRLDNLKKVSKIWKDFYHSLDIDSSLYFNVYRWFRYMFRTYHKTLPVYQYFTHSRGTTLYTDECVNWLKTTTAESQQSHSKLAMFCYAKSHYEEYRHLRDFFKTIGESLENKSESFEAKSFGSLKIFPPQTRNRIVYYAFYEELFEGVPDYDSYDEEDLPIALTWLVNELAYSHACCSPATLYEQMKAVNKLLLGLKRKRNCGYDSE